MSAVLCQLKCFQFNTVPTSKLISPPKKKKPNKLKLTGLLSIINFIHTLLHIYLFMVLVFVLILVLDLEGLCVDWYHVGLCCVVLRLCGLIINFAFRCWIKAQLLHLTKWAGRRWSKWVTKSPSKLPWVFCYLFSKYFSFFTLHFDLGEMGSILFWGICWTSLVNC